MSVVLQCCGGATHPVPGSGSLFECAKCGVRWQLLRATQSAATEQVGRDGAKRRHVPCDKCGDVILADTELDPAPLCYDCHVERGGEP